MQIDLSSDLLEHDELDLLLWIWDFSFHTVVITKSEWLDRDNGNLYLTETKQWLAFYLYLLMFVIPNSPNHITMSASLREWAWRRVYSLLVDIIGSNRIYFSYSQLLHISSMVVARSFTRGMWYWTWLRSGLNPKFTLLGSFVLLGGREESCWVSAAWESWVRCLHWYYI